MTEGCDHVGYPELVEMAERHLRERSIAEDEWEGVRVRYGENVNTPYWVSILLEIERREGAWVMTRLDRRQEPVAPEEEGLRVEG